MDELISLSKLFDKKIFRIPDYQRGYAWGIPQLSDFWDDLTSLPEDKYHYTGMLSLKKLTSNDYSDWKEEKWIIEDKGYEAYHIVDGQQRLTTFVILVSCILKFAISKDIKYINSDDLDDIKSRYIVEFKKPAKIMKAYKFGYESDNPSFDYLRYNILEEEKSGSLLETFYTLNLENAKNFFNEKIEELFDIEGEKGIESLFKKLVNKLQFNINYIGNDFDVYVAFETMNNRGKKLSNLEILKNRLIYLTTLYPDKMLSVDDKNQLRRDINDAWKEVYFQLGRNKEKPLNDDEYLKNHWTLFFKYTRNKGNDYINFLLGQYFNPKAVYGIKRKPFEEVKYEDDEHIPSDKDYENQEDLEGFLTPLEIKKYVDSLKEIAQYWYYSYNPDECSLFTNDEKKWINKLNRIGINYFRTTVVASFVNSKVSSKERVKLFKTIEKFIFLCFRLGHYQSSYLSNITYGYARQLLKDEIDVNDIISYFENKFNDNIVESTDTFITRMISSFKKDNGFYSWYDLNYFLFEYESYLAEGTTTKLNDWSNFIKNEKDKISIEHIFPQTHTKWYWRNQFRSYSEEEQKCLANSLGNLLALSQSVNSSLQNDEFNLKKNPNGKRLHGYSNGSNSEIEVSKYEDWNPDAILERGLHLLDFMENRWGFKFNPDKKYALLGLEFMLNERENLPELPHDEVSSTGELSVSEEVEDNLIKFLSNKEPEMIYLYNSLYKTLKDKINGLYSVSTRNYIRLRNDLNINIAEIHINKSNLKILIKEPTKVINKIGTLLPKSHNWTLDYSIYLEKEEDIDKVVSAIYDSYQRL